jgi:hypothetical protein
MRRIQTVLFGTLALALTASAAAAQPDVRVDGDDITITGCVGRPDPSIGDVQDVLAWTRDDIMLAYAQMVGDTFGLGGSPGPFFYWLDETEELLAQVGNRVEVEGELGDFEDGEVKIERDDDFTEITVTLEGDEETARLPTSWLGADRDDIEFEIVTRRIDVDEVRVLGPCDLP